jgi:tmRNA-binding protein
VEHYNLLHKLFITEMAIELTKLAMIYIAQTPRITELLLQQQDLDDGAEKIEKETLVQSTLR